MSRLRPVAAGVVGLAIGLALAGVLGSTSGGALAQGRPLEPGPGVSVEALPDGDRLVVLLDPASQSLVLYVYDVEQGTLRLSAARHFSSDLRLLEYNNAPPGVGDIRKFIDR